MGYLNGLAELVNNNCEKKGWNENVQMGNVITNCHAELSEAWEEYRTGKDIHVVYFNEGGPKPEGFGIEIADEFIRLLHLCAYYKLDIDQLIDTKMRYNETRSYRHGNKIA
jgi:NTP pyrophosphatase (non-canonical NTP hydrolase)